MADSKLKKEVVWSNPSIDLPKNQMVKHKEIKRFIVLKIDASFICNVKVQRQTPALLTGQMRRWRPWIPST
jgi:hypothetical protein